MPSFIDRVRTGVATEPACAPRVRGWRARKRRGERRRHSAARRLSLTRRTRTAGRRPAVALRRIRGIQRVAGSRGGYALGEVGVSTRNEQILPPYEALRQ